MLHFNRTCRKMVLITLGQVPCRGATHTHGELGKGPALCHVLDLGHPSLSPRAHPGRQRIDPISQGENVAQEGCVTHLGFHSWWVGGGGLGPGQSGTRTGKG